MQERFGANATSGVIDDAVDIGWLPMLQFREDKNSQLFIGKTLMTEAKQKLKRQKGVKF